MVQTLIKKVFIWFLIFCFLLSTEYGSGWGYAADQFVLPKPGTMVHLSPPLSPPILKGIKVYTDNPFKFEFIVDKGDIRNADLHFLQGESSRLIKYFLASLTIPAKDLWVNLSPYEKERIVPEAFGLTEMGRDLLAQDYMLKQITASLIYPEDEVGKKFWKRVYEEAAARYHTTNIPVSTFNKVWIVPEKAVVYENAKAGTAYVVESRLKVMLEEDYLAQQKHEIRLPAGRQEISNDQMIETKSFEHSKLENSKIVSNIRTLDDSNINGLGSKITREIVIPALNREVNEGKNFAQVRQVYNSLILATWYKKKIKDSILGQIYADKNKIAGVGYSNSVIASEAKQSSSVNEIASAPSAPRNDTNDVDAIYQQYISAFKKGAYNYIKEEFDPVTKEPIPRKYFSGGLSIDPDKAMIIQISPPQVSLPVQNQLVVQVRVAEVPIDPLASGDKAMVVSDRLLSQVFPHMSQESAQAVVEDLKRLFPHWDIAAALELPKNELIRDSGSDQENGANDYVKENWGIYQANQYETRGEFLLFLRNLAEVREPSFPLLPLIQWTSQEVDTNLNDRQVSKISFSGGMTAKRFVNVLRTLHQVHLLGGDSQNDRVYYPATILTYKASDQFTSKQWQGHEVKGRTGRLARFDEFIKYKSANSRDQEIQASQFEDSQRRYQRLYELIWELKEGAKSGALLKQNIAKIAEFYMITMQKRQWIFLQGAGSNSFFMNAVNMFLRLSGLKGIYHGHYENFFISNQHSSQSDLNFLSGTVDRYAFEDDRFPNGIWIRTQLLQKGILQEIPGSRDLRLTNPYIDAVTIAREMELSDADSHRLKAVWEKIHGFLKSVAEANSERINELPSIDEVMNTIQDSAMTADKPIANTDASFVIDDYTLTIGGKKYTVFADHDLYPKDHFLRIWATQAVRGSYGHKPITEVPSFWGKTRILVLRDDRTINMQGIVVVSEMAQGWQVMYAAALSETFLKVLLWRAHSVFKTEKSGVIYAENSPENEFLLRQHFKKEPRTYGQEEGAYLLDVGGANALRVDFDSAMVASESAPSIQLLQGLRQKLEGLTQRDYFPVLSFFNRVWKVNADSEFTFRLQDGRILKGFIDNSKKDPPTGKYAEFSPANSITLQGHEEKILPSSVLSIEADQLLSMDLDNHINGLVYINSNEAGSDYTIETLQNLPAGSNEVHVGVSGWFNFDMMAARRSTYGIILDRNGRVKDFSRKVGEIISESKDRHEFVDKVTGFLRTVPGRDYASPEDMQFIQESLSYKDSWLGSDESFEYVKQMFQEGRIHFLRADLRTQAVFEKVREWLSENRLRIGTLYVSNVRQWLADERGGGIPQENLKVMNDAMALISDENTHIIEASKFSFDYPMAQRVIRAAEYEPFLGLNLGLQKDAALATKGGIDLNTDKMNLHVQNEGGAISFQLDSAKLKQLQEAPGLIPIMVHMQPLTDLNAFLGITVEHP